MSDAGAISGRRRSKNRLARGEALTFYLLISPWLVGLLLFVLGPIVASLSFSFTRWDMLAPPVPTGLRNYERMVNDRLFWQSFVSRCSIRSCTCRRNCLAGCCWRCS